MSDKPDLSELFSMLAEEKAKNSYEKKTESKKSKTYKADFMEEFSKELKKLKEEEEQQKREVAAMEVWLTSPVETINEEVKNEVETSEEETEFEEPVVFKEEETEEEVELVAETPLQEQAISYLNDKREELSEEAKQIKGMKREMASFSDQLTKLRMLMQNAGGGGIAKIRQADDIDRTTALVNNKYLKYDSSTGKFVGADASGGGGDYGDSDVNTLLGAVTVDIIPNTTESIDLGSSSKRFNELFLAGQTIDLGGTKITKDTDGNVELKDGNDALKKIIVDEIQLGSGDDKLKIQKSNGKLKVLDNSDAKASHDVAFSEITGKPTTISGYGITDAFDGAYSSLTGTPTIPTDVNDLSDDDSLLGGGGISLTALSINPVEGTASGDGGIAYNNLTGVFTYTPPDLSSYLTSYTVTSGDVTAHEGDITITESQISDLQSYLTSVSEAAVTAHEAALTITESQISDLGSYITDYTVTEGDVTAHQAALSITESQISDLGTYATVASPTLTGTPAAPTAATGTDTTQLATTAFVQQEINALKALLYAYDQS